MLTEQATALLYGKPLVKPSAIEGELERVRSATAAQDAARDAERGGPAAARVKATLKNVLLLNTQCGTPSSDTEIDRLIDTLCFAHPSRFFVVDGNLAAAKSADAGKMGLATAVSSRCFLAESGAHVCSEEIYISATGASVSHIPNLLVSLLVPDIDTVLLVLGDLCDAKPEVHQLLSGMVEVSDQVVYDSSEFADYASGVQILLTALAPTSGEGTTPASPKTQKLYDLNWPRLRRWRSLVAEGFDAERFVSASDHIHRVRLSIAADPERPAMRVSAEAALIGGWMLASLQLTPETRRAKGASKECSITCRGDRDRQLTFACFSAQVQGADPGALTGIDVDVESPTFHGRIGVQRRFDQGTAEIAMGFNDGSDGCESENACDYTVRSLPFPTPSFADKVLLALTARRADSLFRQALDLSLKILQSLGTAKS